MYTEKLKCFRTTRETRSEDRRVRGQRATSQTEGCIVDRKVKNTCGFQHVSVGQITSLPRESPACFSYRCRFSFHYVYTLKQTCFSLCTHQADASYARLGHRTMAHLRGLLPEEEIQLVVISLCAVGNELYVDESGVCGEKRWWVRRRINLGKHLAETFYKLSAFPVYHLLRDSKHICTHHFSFQLYIWNPVCILKRQSGRLHTLGESRCIMYRLNRTFTI